MCQRISKLSLPVPWKGFEIKSHQVRAHYLKPLRNGRQISPVVASGATPKLIRVNPIPVNSGMTLTIAAGP